MQVKIKTKRGTVELSFEKLRLFRRMRVVEAKEETTAKTVAALLWRVERLEKVAESCPYQNRAADSVERREVDQKVDREAYTPDEMYLAWTEGEDAVRQLRAERERELSLKGGRSA